MKLKTMFLGFAIAAAIAVPAQGATFRFALQLGELYKFEHPGTYQVALIQAPIYLMPGGDSASLSGSNSIVLVVRSPFDALKKQIENCSTDVDANIDPQNQGAQRAAIKKMMLGLPQSARCGSVAGGGPNGLISNREGDFVDENISGPWRPLGDGSWKKPSGEVVALPGDVLPAGPPPTEAPLSTPGAFVGAWKCGAPPAESLYVLTAFGKGNRRQLASRATAERFTYSLSNDFMVEKSEAGVATRHRFLVQGDVLKDRTTDVRRDGRWEPLPVATALDCKRLS